MIENTVIVWDLETVPDLEAAGRALDIVRSPPSEIRAALGEGFPKLPFHKIVCIGALIAARCPEGWRTEALGAPHLGDRSEAELIRAFIDKVGELRPQLITFNGNSFDLPVLRYRAMVNRVMGSGLQVRPYFHRYTEDALDLCDVLGSFTGQAKVRLDEIAKVLGLAGKPQGMDGGQVENFVNDGKLDQVADYCETDVFTTYRVWLVYELFRGSINSAELAWSEAQAREFIMARRKPNRYLSALAHT